MSGVPSPAVSAGESIEPRHREEPRGSSVDPIPTVSNPKPTAASGPRLPGEATEPRARCKPRGKHTGAVQVASSPGDAAPDGITQDAEETEPRASDRPEGPSAVAVQANFRALLRTGPLRAAAQFLSRTEPPRTARKFSATRDANFVLTTNLDLTSMGAAPSQNFFGFLSHSFDGWLPRHYPHTCALPFLQGAVQVPFWL